MKCPHCKKEFNEHELNEKERETLAKEWFNKMARGETSEFKSPFAELMNTFRNCLENKQDPIEEIRRIFGEHKVNKNLYNKITKAIRSKSVLVPFDYLDVLTIIKGAKTIEAKTVKVSGKDRIKRFNEELIKIKNLNKSTGALIYITGGDDLQLDETSKIGELVSEALGKKANVIWGVKIDSKFKDDLEIDLVYAK